MKPSSFVLPAATSAVLLSLLAALVGPATPVRTAYACSGSIDFVSLDYFASAADAIAVVDVFLVGGAENETPPLPPGTPVESIAGPGHVPAGFDFEGYRATASVRQAIAGAVGGQIVIDAALRAELERIVRRWELGARYAPCFFGMQDRYTTGAAYLVFLARNGEGWDTLRAYEVEGEDVLLARDVTWISPHGRKSLFASQKLLDAMGPDLAARSMGEDVLGGVYGELWVLEQERVPLSSVLNAIAEVRTITPPATGSGGLR